MVRRVGFEPTCPFGQWILRPSRIPFRHRRAFRLYGLIRRDTYLETGLRSVLWAIIILLLIFWVVGLVAHIAGFFINVLLFIAIAVLAYDLFIRRRRA
jgi:hypothetical protein